MVFFGLAGFLFFGCLESPKMMLIEEIATPDNLDIIEGGSAATIYLQHQQIDGGAADTNYLSNQRIDGGGA